MNILIGTNYINSEEPCMAVVETDMQAPDYSGFKRYQIVRVLRNDKITEFRRVLGDSKDFKKEPFQIIGGVQEGNKIYIEHKVGELLDIADKERERTSFDKKELARIN